MKKASKTTAQTKSISSDLQLILDTKKNEGLTQAQALKALMSRWAKADGMTRTGNQSAFDNVAPDDSLINICVQGYIDLGLVPVGSRGPLAELIMADIEIESLREELDNAYEDHDARFQELQQTRKQNEDLRATIRILMKEIKWYDSGLAIHKFNN